MIERVLYHASVLFCSLQTRVYMTRLQQGSRYIRAFRVTRLYNFAYYRRVCTLNHLQQISSCRCAFRATHRTFLPTTDACVHWPICSKDQAIDTRSEPRVCTVLPTMDVCVHWPIYNNDQATDAHSDSPVCTVFLIAHNTYYTSASHANDITHDQNCSLKRSKVHCFASHKHHISKIIYSSSK
jgi:hypothetical protein